jgi:hypothetical protein
MFKIRRVFEKGEIATLITIGSLIFLGVSSLASSYFLKDKKTSTTQAGKTCPATCSFGCTADGKCAKATSAQWGVKDSTGRIGIIGPTDAKGRSTLSTENNVGRGNSNVNNRTGEVIPTVKPTNPPSKSTSETSGEEKSKQDCNVRCGGSQNVDSYSPCKCAILPDRVSPTQEQKDSQQDKSLGNISVSSCSNVTGKYRCGKDPVTGCYIWRSCPCTCSAGCNGEACARQADNADHGYLNPQDIVSGSNLQKYSCRNGKCVPSSEGDYFTPYCDGQCGGENGGSTSFSQCGQIGQSCCPGSTKCYGGSVCTDGICISNNTQSQTLTKSSCIQSCYMIRTDTSREECINQCKKNEEERKAEEKREQMRGEKIMACVVLPIPFNATDCDKGQILKINQEQFICCKYK